MSAQPKPGGTEVEVRCVNCGAKWWADAESVSPGYEMPTCFTFGCRSISVPTGKARTTP